MALKDTIQEIADDMAILQSLTITVLNELRMVQEEGLPEPSVSIGPGAGSELNSLIASRKSIEKQLMSIKKKITDAVKIQIDAL